MKKIYKYSLGTAPGIVTFRMPKGVQFLSVQAQDGDAVLWGLIGPEDELEERKVQLVETGQYFNYETGWGSPVFLGTVQLGGYVLRAFEIQK